MMLSSSFSILAASTAFLLTLRWSSSSGWSGEWSRDQDTGLSLVESGCGVGGLSQPSLLRGQSYRGENHCKLWHSSLKAYYGDYNFYTLTWKNSPLSKRAGMGWWKISVVEDDVDLLHSFKEIKIQTDNVPLARFSSCDSLYDSLVTAYLIMCL